MEEKLIEGDLGEEVEAAVERLDYEALDSVWAAGRIERWVG